MDNWLLSVTENLNYIFYNVRILASNVKLAKKKKDKKLFLTYKSYFNVISTEMFIFYPNFVLKSMQTHKNTLHISILCVNLLLTLMFNYIKKNNIICRLCFEVKGKLLTPTL